MTPLVIKVNSSVPNGTQNKWTDFTDELPNLTKRIATPAINKNTDIGAIVSGIPTPFARANLFNSALNFSKMQEGEESTDLNLNAYYDRVCSEWRGFIACIAMDYSRLSVKRVYMNYSRGTSVLDTPNVYEPKGAFGNKIGRAHV